MPAKVVILSPMQTIVTKRLLFSCIYLGALFLVAGTVFYRTQYFSGTIFLPDGNSEHLVVRPHDGSLGIGLSQRNVPADLLMLDNPGVTRALPREGSYDAVVLPFGLRLEEAVSGEAIPPIHTLVVEGPSDIQTVTVEAGDRVSIGRATLTVGHIGPWEGLLRNASGVPMAAVVLDSESPWTGPTHFLESGRWYTLSSAQAIYFAWHDNEPSARDAFAASLDEIDYVRWGVRDGAAMQWFEGLIPGTGLTLRDGTKVMLRAVLSGGQTIRLAVDGGEGPVDVTVEANVGDHTRAYQFESPAATGHGIMLHAWREDEVVCRVLRRDRPAEERVLSPGTDWAIPPEGPTLHLAAVMDSAVPVAGGKLDAVYLQTADHTYSIREGLVETIEGHRIHYEKVDAGGGGRYTIDALDASGARIATRSLTGNNSARVGAWVFRLTGENPAGLSGIAVTATRRPGGWTQGIGLGLFLAGSFGLVFVRFAGSRGNR